MSALSIVAQLAAVAQPWADLYDGSTVLQSGVMFTHLGGVVLSAGAAVTTDRATLGAWRGGADVRERQLATIRASHRAIAVGLGVSIVSGLLLLGADVQTLLLSLAFWIKMGLLVALMGNGLLIVRADRAASDDVPVSSPDSQGVRLRALSYASLVLWFAVLLASTFLVTAA